MRRVPIMLQHEDLAVVRPNECAQKLNASLNASIAHADMAMRAPLSTTAVDDINEASEVLVFEGTRHPESGETLTCGHHWMNMSPIHSWRF